MKAVSFAGKTSIHRNITVTALTFNKAASTDVLLFIGLLCLLFVLFLTLSVYSMLVSVSRSQKGLTLQSLHMLFCGSELTLKQVMEIGVGSRVNAPSALQAFVARLRLLSKVFVSIHGYICMKKASFEDQKPSDVSHRDV